MPVVIAPTPGGPPPPAPLPPPPAFAPPTLAWESPTGDTLVLSDMAAGYGVQPGRAGFGRTLVELRLDDLPEAGAQIGHVRTPPRSMLIPLLVHGPNQSTLRGRLRRLHSAFPRGQQGRLVIVYPDGDTRWIWAHYHEGLDGEYQGIGYRQFPLRLVATDPYFRSVPPLTVRWTSPPAAAQGFFPFFPLTVAPAQRIGENMTVTNPGDVDAYPVWTIEGPAAAGLMCSHDDTGRSWALTRALTTGEVATIDTRPTQQTAQLADGTNLWPDLRLTPADDAAGDLWPLNPGLNRLSFSVSGMAAETAVSMTVDWLHESE